MSTTQSKFNVYTIVVAVNYWTHCLLKARDVKKHSMQYLLNNYETTSYLFVNDAYTHRLPMSHSLLGLYILYS